MSESYKCDACGEYYDGHPEVRVSFNPAAREVGGDMHFGSGVSFEWKIRDANADLCADCFADAHRELVGVMADE